MIRAAWLLTVASVALLLSGCAHFTASRKACADGATRMAAEQVVPRLTNGILCSTRFETDDEIVACVKAEFEKLKTEVQPTVFACALALVADAVSVQ